jgi:hypothetical protein
MKITINKIISALAVATVLLSASFTTIPTPIPESDNSIPIIVIELEFDKDKDGEEGNEAEPQFDEPIDPEDEILQ